MADKDMNIKIIHEEADFIIINKPAGLITHIDGKEKNKDMDSVAKQMVKLYPEIKDVGEQDDKFERFGIVHRLDADTSGIMIIARNQDFYLYIKDQFQTREVEKEYRTIVYGNFVSKKGCVIDPIGRSKSDFRKFVCGRFARGEVREATTYFEVLNNFTIDGQKYAYLSVKPKTGRTHQIRVHLKHVQHSIVGDRLYTSGIKADLGLKRQALHAHTLSFTDMKAQKRVFEAELASDICNIIKNCL
jgi:23S rRNA pseudouridine1911/1915/1917 synthase